MFHGLRADIAPWFASLGYERHHGDESDWLLDLVATGFDKPRQMYGNLLMQQQDIAPAAEAFTASYVKVIGCRQTLLQHPHLREMCACFIMRRDAGTASSFGLAAAHHLGATCQPAVGGHTEFVAFLPVLPCTDLGVLSAQCTGCCKLQVSTVLLGSGFNGEQQAGPKT
jgi:hypothetical protein